MQHAHLKKTILEMLDDRGEGKTICPSEVARRVGGQARADWEPLMGPVREAARALVAEHMLVIMQRGRIVDGDTAKGAIRLRLC